MPQRAAMEMTSAAIIAAVITGAFSLIGVVVTNNYANRQMEMRIQQNQAVMETKIDELTRRVNLHNQVVERTYDLERRVSIMEATDGK